MELHIIDPTAQSEDKAIKKSKVKSYKADISYDEQHWTTKLIDALLNDLKELGMREVKGEWDEIPQNLYKKT
jgi:hypothetical protein